MGCCEEQIIQLNYGSQTVKVGPRGPQGIQGIQGAPGESITALGVETSYAALLTAHPTPNVLDAYILQDTSHFWIYDPTSTAANVDGWVDMGALQGPAGIQGIQGIQGIAGTSSYVYAGFWDSTKTNFSYDPTTVSGGVAYMKLLTSTATIVPSSLTSANFVVGGTITYVTGFIPVGGVSGGGGSSSTPVTTSGTFLSGGSNPSGSATTGDIYLNKSTFVYWQYNGTSWIAFPGYTFDTSWNITSVFSPWIAGTSSNAPVYKQGNKEVVLSGKVSPNTNIITDVIICTLPSHYRSSRNQYVEFINSTAGQKCMGKIDYLGNVYYLGSYIPANALDEIWLDTVKISLL
jgi:hypothetical protein